MNEGSDVVVVVVAVVAVVVVVFVVVRSECDRGANGGRHVRKRSNEDPLNFRLKTNQKCRKQNLKLKENTMAL